MTRAGWIAAGAVAWGAIGVVDGAAVNANMRAKFPSLTVDVRWTRENCGDAVFIAIGGPVAFPAAFLMTGFYQDGLSFSCSPEPRK